MANLAQRGLVIKAGNSIVGQLLRGDLGAGQTAHVDNGNQFLDAGGAGTLDAVMSGDNLQPAIGQNKERQALQLAALLDVLRQLVLHLVLHNAGVDVLLFHEVDVHLGDNKARTHVIDYFVVFTLFSCHCFSFLSHSVSVSFSLRVLMIGASYVSL